MAPTIDVVVLAGVVCWRVGFDCLRSERSYDVHTSSKKIRKKSVRIVDYSYSYSLKLRERTNQTFALEITISKVNASDNTHALPVATERTSWKCLTKKRNGCPRVVRGRSHLAFLHAVLFVAKQFFTEYSEARPLQLAIVQVQEIPPRWSVSRL